MFELDHLVIFVADLDEATKEFSEQGFTVTPGGMHGGGLTKNALIAFPDSTYLELLAFTPKNPYERFSSLQKSGALEGFLEQRSGLDCRFVPKAVYGPGVRDFALRGSAHDAIIRGTIFEWAVTGPLPGTRTKPDGFPLAWNLALPEEPGIPFVIEDVTPVVHRIPNGESSVHENGVQGIYEIEVAVPDPLHVEAGMTGVFGFETVESAEHEVTLDAKPGRIKLVKGGPPFGPTTFKLWDAEGYEW
ncbi:MAG: VOC family protein, partial [Gemmatimonadota bacterium]|nr:VOC family protein [Gemmatimonadota bacterium]